MTNVPMTNENLLENFLQASEAWICDGYALDVRYMAHRSPGELTIWEASIALNPLPPIHDHGFHIDSGEFVFGQIQVPKLNKGSLVSILKAAGSGEIEARGEIMRLPKSGVLDYFSEMLRRDRWFSDLHLQVIGTGRPPLANIVLSAIDNRLRKSIPPFDGLVDIANWLGFRPPATTTNPPWISVRVGPPVDIIHERTALTKDVLTITLHAHPKFESERLGLAIRAVPGVALKGRQQIAEKVVWGGVRKGRRVGVAKVRLDQADNVLVMLQIAGSTVRRQWFVDPEKARNNRLLAVQQFDKDLRMIKSAVLESTDSAKFEQGIAALLFLSGFTPCIQLETDAPDLVVTTPGGKLVIAECTMRISDFASKVGKLVDRRGALSKQLAASGHQTDVTAVMFCRLPSDQIAVHTEMVRAQSIVMVPGESLQAALDRVRAPLDPDKALEDALTNLTRGGGPK